MPLELSILRDFTVFHTFSPQCVQLLHWNFVHNLEIKFKDNCYLPIFGRFMPLELSHFRGFFSFTDFFPQFAQLLHWNFVHTFTCISIRFKIKLEDHQINSREIVSGFQLSNIDAGGKLTHCMTNGMILILWQHPSITCIWRIYLSTDSIWRGQLSIRSVFWVGVDYRTDKLMLQGFLQSCLISSFSKFCARYNDLICS
jgi:hypothetical protein